MTLDALCGYWQIPLAEDDQPLTTFIIPYGRFRYLQGPMGSAATRDAYCLRGDMVLQGGDAVCEGSGRYSTVRRGLPHTPSPCQRCPGQVQGSRHTLNAEKLVLAAPAVTFCGYRLSHYGIAADPENVLT